MSGEYSSGIQSLKESLEENNLFKAQISKLDERVNETLIKLSKVDEIFEYVHQQETFIAKRDARMSIDT